jgi:hypothetical protein
MLTAWAAMRLTEAAVLDRKGTMLARTGLDPAWFREVSKDALQRVSPGEVVIRLTTARNGCARWSGSDLSDSPLCRALHRSRARPSR